MRAAITVTLVPETRAGPFVFSAGLADAFARAAGLGFDAVEIFPASAEETPADEIERLRAAHGLRVAAFGTGAGWVRHGLRLTDPDPAARRRAVEFIGRIIALGARFGAPAIIGSMQGRADPGVSPETALGWLAEGLAELGGRAQAAGVPLLLEPLNRYETNLCTSLGAAAALLERAGSPAVRLLADLFHMNIEETDLAAALRAAGPRLGHVHFADSNRRAPGFGHTDFRPVITALRELGYAGYLSAEVLAWPDPEAAARQVVARFRALTAP
jgi:sugar phosphate isomerase/epimerase